MSLNELERKYIKPLSRLEKLQLIADITKMLQLEDEHLENYFKSGESYPVITPTITPDDAPYEAAFQLQQLWEQHEDQGTSAPASDTRLPIRRLT